MYCYYYQLVRGLQAADEVPDQEYSGSHNRESYEKIENRGRRIGALFYFSLDLFESYIGQYGDERAEADEQDAEYLGVTVAGLKLWRGFDLSQKKCHLLHEQREPLDDETEGHDPDARPDPGKERPLVRHMHTAMPLGGCYLLFRLYFRHKV